MQDVFKDRKNNQFPKKQNSDMMHAQHDQLSGWLHNSISVSGKIIMDLS